MTTANRTPHKSDESSNGRSFTGGLAWALPVAAAIVVADQFTKRWAVDRLTAGSCDQPDACIDLVAGAKFHLVFNTGAAFARGSGFGPLLGVLAIVITCALLVVAWQRTDRIGIISAGAMAGGAVGNLVDRATRAEDGILSGAVVDFVDLGWWPVFNIADVAIVGGVVGFVLASWLEERRAPATNGAIATSDEDTAEGTAGRKLD